MATTEMVRIHTYNTKEETKMKNEAMNARNQLPGGGFHGGEQQTSLPGGGFHRDEQQSDPSEGWQKVTLLLENGERVDVLIEQDQKAIWPREDGRQLNMLIHDGHLVSELAWSFV